jgi:RNA polymerase sigma-70 factor (ECF subfamily)
MPNNEDFVRQADPFRHELLAHCYRMLGSVHDAEDLVQETFLRAWRAYDRFDDRRASLRTWLYRIATNACLTALEGKSRRPLPAGLADPSSEATPLEERPEIPWLQPIPDRLLDAEPADPATIVASRASVRLAFIAALQHLPPRQRAVLLLRDVLSWRAAEVAELLGISTAAVNSALQRARAHLSAAAPEQDKLAEPARADDRNLLNRYVTAFQTADLAALMRLLHEDAVTEMPPYQTWFRGHDVHRQFFDLVLVRRGPGAWVMDVVGANRQLAVAAYVRRDDGLHHAHSVQVITTRDERVDHIVAFQGAKVFEMFDLPPIRPAAPMLASTAEPG